jgi:hypothetical protein
VILLRGIQLTHVPRYFGSTVKMIFSYKIFPFHEANTFVVFSYKIFTFHEANTFVALPERLTALGARTCL